MPEDPGLYVIQWLRKRLGRSAPGRMPLREEVQAMKDELKKVHASADEFMAGTAEAEKEEEEEDDEEGELQEEPSFKAAGGVRVSVSAEAYGAWNVYQAHEPPVYPKTDEQKERLRKVLSNSFMFQAVQ